MSVLTNKSAKRQITINALKSFVVFFASSLTFVIIITIFPLIGSLTMNGFPIIQVIKDNFRLLIPLFFVCIIISPFVGWASYKIQKRRFLYLLLMGFGACMLAILAVMLMYFQTGFSNFNESDLNSFILIAVWAFIAYSFFSIPVLIPAILLIEKWTRNKVN